MGYKNLHLFYMALQNLPSVWTFIVELLHFYF